MNHFTVLGFVPEYDLTTPSYSPYGGGEFDWRLGEKLNSLSLIWTAQRGIDSGELSFNVPALEAVRWMETGLGLHIEVRDMYGINIWDGFVNHLSFQIGGLVVELGPLTDVANQVGVTYTPILSVSTTEVIVGEQTETVLTVSDSSQRRYGVLEKWFAGEPGRCWPPVAEAQRDRVLRDRAWPKPTQAIQLLTGEPVAITAQLLGYVHRLSTTIYENITTGTTQLSTKVAAVIDADPNGIFSSANALVEDNAFLVPAIENDNRVSLVVLDELTAIGASATDDRWLMQVWPDRYIKFGAAPLVSAPKYQRSIYNQSGGVELYGTGNSIKPWRVWPGNWLYQPDLFPVAMPIADREADARYLFIEEVHFQSPYEVSISANPQSSLPQMIAKAQVTLS